MFKGLMIMKNVIIDKFEISLGNGGGCSTVCYRKGQVSISSGSFIMYEDSIFDLRIYKSDPLFESFNCLIRKAIKKETSFEPAINSFKKLCLSKITYTNLTSFIKNVYRDGHNDGQMEIKQNFRELMGC